ncbi:neuronal acetylcholine receptor subunit alpha-9-like [Glandiceps talaboti]
MTAVTAPILRFLNRMGMPQLTVILLIFGQTSASNYTAKLVNDLLNSYPRIIRPVLNDSTTTVITHRMTPVQMVKVDEINQIITIKCWLSQIWYDDYLSWESTDYGNTTEIRMPIDNIWQPDIILLQSVTSKLQRHFDTDVIITHVGKVTALQPSLLEATCIIDSTFFPFDEQKCVLTFSSWANPTHLVDIEPDQASNMDNFASNGEWELVAMGIEKRHADEIAYGAEFSEVSYIVHLKRRSLFYILNIMFPFFLTCALVAVSFYLPSECGERITLCVTSILAQFVFLEIITQHMPPNSENVPYLQKYFFASIGGVAVSTLFTAFSLNIHFQPTDCEPVSSWVKIIMFRYLAPIACVKTKAVRKQKGKTRPKSEKMGFIQDSLKIRGVMVDHKHSTDLKRKDSNYLTYNDVSVTDTTDEDCRRSSKETHAEIMSDWRKLAKIIDRIYLLLYLITIISMIIGFTLTLQRNAKHHVAAG